MGLSYALEKEVHLLFSVRVEVCVWVSRFGCQPVFKIQLSFHHLGSGD